jgi:predicted ATPase
VRCAPGVRVRSLRLLGREAQLQTLVAELTAVGRPATPVVAVIGMGGLGKSALAVRAGHQSAPAYPDGALHLDLRDADADPPVPLPTPSLQLVRVAVPRRRAAARDCT